MTYKAETSDEGVFYVFDAKDDSEAFSTAREYAHGDKVELFNIAEVDNDYEEIRTVF